LFYIVIGALVIGFTLGIMGSGGSILTVPVLTYLLGHSSKSAVAESLAIVGAIAIVAVFPYAKSKQVDWRSVVFFGVPGMAGTYLGAWIAGYVSGAAQLTLFALVMLLAAYTMFRPPAKIEAAGEGEPRPPHARWKIGVEGVIVGVVTGLVGVGGGFLIVPALVVLGGLPMRMAVGTSLAVIALKSGSGLYKYLDVLETTGASIHWPTVTAFTLIGIVGSLIGKQLSLRFDQNALRQGFAVFLLVMGLFVLGKEAPGLLANRQAAQSRASGEPAPVRDRVEACAIVKPQDHSTTACAGIHEHEIAGVLAVPPGPSRKPVRLIW
jgi:uncharacterized membrane protein YfcA